jgi:hypothetical protein
MAQRSADAKPQAFPFRTPTRWGASVFPSDGRTINGVKHGQAMGLFYMTKGRIDG